jgi:hypothetical protein
MCTGRSSPALMSAYTVLRPMRRTVTASSGVSSRGLSARTSRRAPGHPCRLLSTAVCRMPAAADCGGRATAHGGASVTMGSGLGSFSSSAVTGEIPSVRLARLGCLGVECLLEKCRRRSSHPGPEGCCRTGASCRPPVPQRSSLIASARRVPAAPGRAVLVGGSEADVGPAGVGLEDGVECDGQAGEVAVVDPPVVELLSQLLQRLGPVPTGERLLRRNLNSPLDDADSCPTGGCGPGLLPGALPALRRTPGRDASTGLRLDRPAAPSAGRGRTTAIRGVGRSSARPQSVSGVCAGCAMC